MGFGAGDPLREGGALVALLAPRMFVDVGRVAFCSFSLAGNQKQCVYICLGVLCYLCVCVCVVVDVAVVVAVGSGGVGRRGERFTGDTPTAPFFSSAAALLLSFFVVLSPSFVLVIW